MLAQYAPSRIRFCMGDAPGELCVRLDGMTGGEMMRDSSVNLQILSRPACWKADISLHVERSKRFRLLLRLPQWLSAPAEIRINGEPRAYECAKGFAILEDEWTDAKIEVILPKALRCVALPDDPDMVAFVDGPVCLAGLVGEEHILYGDTKHPEGCLLCADNERSWQFWNTGWKTYHQPFGIRFKPLNQIVHQPYTLYFPVRREGVR